MTLFDFNPETELIIQRLFNFEGLNQFPLNKMAFLKTRKIKENM